MDLQRERERERERKREQCACAFRVSVRPNRLLSVDKASWTNASIKKYRRSCVPKTRVFPEQSV